MPLSIFPKYLIFVLLSNLGAKIMKRNTAITLRYKYEKKILC